MKLRVLTLIALIVLGQPFTDFSDPGTCDRVVRCVVVDLSAKDLNADGPLLQAVLVWSLRFVDKVAQQRLALPAGAEGATAEHTLKRKLDRPAIFVARLSGLLRPIVRKHSGKSYAVLPASRKAIYWRLSDVQGCAEQVLYLPRTVQSLRPPRVDLFHWLDS